MYNNNVRTCHNGAGCFFKTQGKCWFLHDDKVEVKKVDVTIANNSWKNWGLVDRSDTGGFDTRGGYDHRIGRVSNSRNKYSKNIKQTLDQESLTLLKGTIQSKNREERIKLAIKRKQERAIELAKDLEEDEEIAIKAAKISSTLGSLSSSVIFSPQHTTSQALLRPQEERAVCVPMVKIDKKMIPDLVLNSREIAEVGLGRNCWADPDEDAPDNTVEKSHHTVVLPAFHDDLVVVAPPIFDASCDSSQIQGRVSFNPALVPCFQQMKRAISESSYFQELVKEGANIPTSRSFQTYVNAMGQMKDNHNVEVDAGRNSVNLEKELNCLINNLKEAVEDVKCQEGYMKEDLGEEYSGVFVRDMCRLDMFKLKRREEEPENIVTAESARKMVRPCKGQKRKVWGDENVIGTDVHGYEPGETESEDIMDIATDNSTKENTHQTVSPVKMVILGELSEEEARLLSLLGSLESKMINLVKERGTLVEQLLCISELKKRYKC